MDEKIQIQKDLMKEALGKVLEDAKVPMRYHLKIVEALHKSMQEHAKTMKFHEIQMTHDRRVHEEQIAKAAEVFEEHKKNAQTHEQQLQEWNDRVKEFLGIDWTGPKGEDGVTPEIEQIVAQVLPRIPKPKDGKKGEKGDKGDNGLTEKIKVREFAYLIADMMKEERLLDLSHVQGASGFIKDGVKYRFEELMHGGENSSNNSSGITVLPATGLVNGSNKAFAFTQMPSYIISDGAWLTPLDSNGGLQWSWNSGTLVATLVVPPNGSIFGIA